MVLLDLGTKSFLLWLSLRVEEKSAKNDVLAFSRSLSQRPHLAIYIVMKISMCADTCLKQPLIHNDKWNKNEVN